MTASLLLPVRAARACGGGVVTTAEAGTIGANAQRIIISVHGGTTDVVTQIGVPAAGVDYGVLIPMAGQPTLDPNPVASADIDRLFADTAPSIMTQAFAGAVPHQIYVERTNGPAKPPRFAAAFALLAIAALVRRPPRR